MNTDTTKPFEWTTELMKEFFEYKLPSGLKPTMDEWIKIKKSEPVKEKIFIKDIGYIDKGFSDAISILPSNEITFDKLPAIKKAIEQVLNNNTPDQTAYNEGDKIVCSGHLGSDFKFKQPTNDTGKEGLPLPSDYISNWKFCMIDGDGNKKPLPLLFKRGDVVIHKAGGLPMTCDGYKNEAEVKCVWFDKLKLNHGVFSEEVLMHYIKPEQPTNDNTYQTYLKDCDCETGGIILHEGKAVCRWCREPYAKGGMMNYLPKHFKQSKQSEQLNTDKEWEVASYILNDVIYTKHSNGYYSQTNDRLLIGNQKDAEIKSVRRLSDNVVFSVGDKVKFSEVSNEIMTIDGFILDYGIDGLWVSTDIKQKYGGSISRAEKLSTPTESIVEYKPDTGLWIDINKGTMEEAKMLSMLWEKFQPIVLKKN